MFVAAQLSVAMVCLIVLYSCVYPASYKAEWITWLSLFGCLSFGACFGYIASHYWKVGVFFIGAWIGGLLGGLLYGLVLYLVGNKNPTLTLWLTIMTSALVVALLAIKYFLYIAMLGSAIMGAYFLVRVRY